MFAKLARTPRLLVVDDQKTNLQIIGTILGEFGFDITLAEDGEEAMQRLEHSPVDLILLDVLMPGRDGFEVCQDIRSHLKWSDIPVIFLSAADDKNLIVRALEMGGVDYVTKPFNKAELISRVRTQVALKMARDKLKQLAEDKDELLGILAHDLKNHLGGMKMSVELLHNRAKKHADARLEQMAGNIRTSTHLMLTFVHEFLANSAADRDFSLNVEPIWLHQVTSTAVQNYVEAARRKGIALEHSGMVDNPVSGDRKALDQVLDNLLSNAIKFSPPGKSVRVIVQPGQFGGGTCCVQDEGPGFTEEDKIYMFNRYRRLSARPTAGEPSTGLGLSIVKKLVNDMGGQIRCESRHGEGATFIINLPPFPKGWRAKTMDFLIIDDDRIFREATCLLIEDEGHYAEGAATSEVALDALKMGKFDAIFLDVHLGRQNGLQLLPTILKMRPTQSVVMFSAQGTVKNAVQAIQQGAVDFLEKPFTREQFHAVVARLRRFNEMGKKIEKLEEQVKETTAQQPGTLVDFETPAMQHVMAVLKRAAKSPASVLILGESGTGKSVAARALHEHSHLADKPFVTVSCPSLTRELLESTLFGHVRGSFTGAMKDHWGKVKAADGGTLFLDEIGDLPLEIQPKLLRLLQEREYERVGETAIQRAEVRIVAATNRDLKKRVEEGAFREDLYYRLNVITVSMPPLRDCPRDMLRFAEHYLKHCSEQCASAVKGFTPAAEELMRRYTWPGNLRELHNTIERSVILASGTQLDVSDFPLELRMNPKAEEGPDEELRVGSMVTLQRMEDQHIRQVIKNCPNLNEAADILGIDQATLYRKRIKMGLKTKIAPGKIPVASADHPAA